MHTSLSKRPWRKSALFHRTAAMFLGNCFWVSKGRSDGCCFTVFCIIDSAHTILRVAWYDQFRTLTRISGTLNCIWHQIRNLRETLAIQGWSGFSEVWSGNKPNRNLAHKYSWEPAPTVFDPNCCIDSNFDVRFNVVYCNHELYTQTVEPFNPHMPRFRSNPTESTRKSNSPWNFDPGMLFLWR